MHLKLLIIVSFIAMVSAVPYWFHGNHNRHNWHRYFPHHDKYHQNHRNQQYHRYPVWGWGNSWSHRPLTTFIRPVWKSEDMSSSRNEGNQVDKLLSSITKVTPYPSVTSASLEVATILSNVQKPISSLPSSIQSSEQNMKTSTPSSSYVVFPTNSPMLPKAASTETTLNTTTNDPDLTTKNKSVDESFWLPEGRIIFEDATESSAGQSSIYDILIHDIDQRFTEQNESLTPANSDQVDEGIEYSTKLDDVTTTEEPIILYQGSTQAAQTTEIVINESTTEESLRTSEEIFTTKKQSSDIIDQTTISSTDLTTELSFTMSLPAEQNEKTTHSEFITEPTTLHNDEADPKEVAEGDSTTQQHENVLYETEISTIEGKFESITSTTQSNDLYATELKNFTTENPKPQNNIELRIDMTTTGSVVETTTVPTKINDMESTTEGSIMEATTVEEVLSTTESELDDITTIESTLGSNTITTEEIYVDAEGTDNFTEHRQDWITDSAMNFTTQGADEVTESSEYSYPEITTIFSGSHITTETTTFQPTEAVTEGVQPVETTTVFTFDTTTQLDEESSINYSIINETNRFPVDLDTIRKETDDNILQLTNEITNQVEIIVSELIEEDYTQNDENIEGRTETVIDTLDYVTLA